MTPVVSVIIAAYNAAKTLPDTVKSIQAQTMQDFEILIIDDCSKDDTFAVASSIAAQDGRITVIQAPVNGGPGAARNIGFDAAKGQWIAIVDSDDIILPERFEKMLVAGKDAGIVFDNLFSEEVEGRRNYVPANAECFGGLNLKTFLRSHRRECPLPNLGFLKPLIRRELLEKYSLRYDPSLMIGEDAFLIMQLMAKGEKVIILPVAYYQYERRSGSISAQQNDKSVRAITNSYYRLLRDYNLTPENAATLKSLIYDNESRLASMEFLKTFPSLKTITILFQFLCWKQDPRILAIETGVHLRNRFKG